MFKGLELNIGDHIAFTTPEVPLPQVEAVVIESGQEGLEVLSTFLAPFRHSGRFTEGQIGQIELVRRAEEAIPMESRGRNFQKEEVVETTIKSGKVSGQVVAAFDGIVVIRTASGELCTGGAKHFHRN